MVPPEIVVLDGHTLNPGDLSWEELNALGHVTVYDRTPPAEIISRAAPAEIILTNKTPLSAPTVASLPRLKYIGVMATGYNVVDAAAARSHGVVVTNVPEYGTEAVAQHTWALLLELARHVGQHALSVRDGKWSSSQDWCYWEQPMIELSGLQLGIVGAGRIGNAVGRIGVSFGMRIRWARRSGGWDELKGVLESSDVVSLHCPLSTDTRGLIRDETIGWMKTCAFIINTSRGGLVVDSDLASALNSGRIAGAALDVLSTEPPSVDNPLLSARNCLITPHHAWAARATRVRLLALVAANLRAYLRKQPTNLVS